MGNLHLHLHHGHGQDRYWIKAFDISLKICKLVRNSVSVSSESKFTSMEKSLGAPLNILSSVVFMDY